MADDQPPKDLAPVSRMMNTAIVVLRREHVAKLQECGYLDKNGYLDILALIHANALLERRRQWEITIVFTLLGVAGGLILKFL